MKGILELDVHQNGHLKFHGIEVREHTWLPKDVIGVLQGDEVIGILRTVEKHKTLADGWYFFPMKEGAILGQATLLQLPANLMQLVKELPKL